MRSLIHVLFIPFAVINAAPSNGSFSPSDTADLDSIRRMLHVTDDLTILARLVNGIALSQGLTDGSVKVNSIVRELLHLGPSITLDPLLNEDVSGLKTDVGVITKTVSDECGGKKDCGDWRSIAAGLTVLEKIRSAVGEMERVLAKTSSLGLTIALGNSLKNISVAKKTSYYLSDPRNQISQSDIRKLQDFVAQLGSLENDYNLTIRSMKTLQQKSIIGDISVMLRFENILKTASVDQKAVDKMRNVLEEMNRKLGVLRSVLSIKAVGVINGKLSSLTQLFKSQSDGFTEMTETSGLFNGFDDLNGYLGDLDTPFVTVTVGNRQNVERLLSLLDPVVKLSEQLKPLQKSWGALRLDQTTDGVELIQKELDAAAKEVDGSFANAIGSIPSIQDCFGNVNLGEKLDFDSWRNIQKQMNNFDQLGTAYRNSISNAVHLFKSSSSLKTYGEFLRNGSNANQFLAQKSSGFDQEFLDLSSAFDNLLNSNFLSYITSTSIEKIPTMEAGWMKKSGVEKALKCLRDNPALTSYEFSIASLDALQKLNSSTANWKSILTASSSLKWPLDDWKKIKTSRSRSVRSVSQLRDARMLSQELSSGVKVIRDLAEVYKKRRAMKKLVDEFDSIDKEVNGLTDPKQKREVENVWTTETKTELKSLVEKVGQLAQTIDESPGKITDFASVFEKFEKFDFPSIDTRKLKSTLSFLKKPPGIQDTLDVIGDLDLKFVLAKKRLQSASGTLTPLMTFFDGFLNITKRANPTTSAGTPKLSTDTSTESEDPIASPFHESTTDSEPSGLWAVFSIFLCIILVVSVAGNLAIAYDTRNKKKELEKKNKQLKKMKQEEKLAKEKEKERERIEKEKAAAAEALKEKESEMGSRKMSTESDQASLPTLSPGTDGQTTGISANNRV